MKVIDWLKGKKTYIIAGAVIVVAILGEFDIVVPEYVWGVLGALGLGFLRAGVQKANE